MSEKRCNVRTDLIEHLHAAVIDEQVMISGKSSFPNKIGTRNGQKLLAHQEMELGLMLSKIEMSCTST